ncbi:MAG TPA: single-stranded-DNA-specific exonuclease RecJ [Chloroflexota bacterium]|nr:single-stranded-DNA-specific exonuclease RecJ [Chloroflexota bacterium]
MEATPDIELRGQRARWRIEPQIPDEIRAELAGESVMLAHLLYCRGFTTAEQIRAFLAGGTISHDPFLLPDMDAAVERIATAIERGERVAVYGDFDCDGITSAVVLVETLRALGGEPIPYLPSREDGHGLHPEGLAALSDQGATLVVTADCGVSAIEEVRVARGMGMDVVVTDHHEVRADLSLPDCPVVNPTRHDSEYPCRHLCGVGVAFKLVQALSRRMPGRVDPDSLLDLVALGTVADVASLVDENRSLVIRGLDRLRSTRRPGLLALFEVAGVDPARIDPISVSFYLAPRINAANRMASPQLAYDLITAGDPAEAMRLAHRLSAHNQERQLLVAETLQGITAQLGDPETVAGEIRAGRRPPLLIVVGTWPAGISGLLAAKLVDAYGVPAFAGTDAGAGTISVSARGVPGVHIDELIERCEAALPAGLFLGYGGHASAGGFRIEAAKLPQARELLAEQSTASIRIDEIGAALTIDAEVGLRRLTLDAARRVRSLAPFGMGFPEPLFLTRGARLKRLSARQDSAHVKLTLQQGDGLIDGIYFNATDEFRRLPIWSALDVVYHLQIDQWQGLQKPQACIRDWRESSQV